MLDRISALISLNIGPFVYILIVAESNTNMSPSQAQVMAFQTQPIP